MVKTMLEKHPDLFGCFDQGTLESVTKKGLSGDDDLAISLRIEAPTYRMTVVSKRYNEL